MILALYLTCAETLTLYSELCLYHTNVISLCVYLCHVQVKLCDPCLSALRTRYLSSRALYKSTYTFTFTICAASSVDLKAANHTTLMFVSMFLTLTALPLLSG